MSTPITLEQATARLTDPATTATDLQTIAAGFPELWPRIAAHPLAYDGLLDWMDENGGPEVHAAVAARRAPVAAPVEPVVAAPVAASAEPVEPVPPRQRRRRGLLVPLAIGLVVLVVLVAAVLIFVFVLAPRTDGQQTSPATGSPSATAPATDQVDQARTALTAAIAQAQKLHDGPPAGCDPAVLTNLQAQIDQARAALDALPGDPTSANSVATQWQASLSNAMALVTAATPASTPTPSQTSAGPCDGVTVPDGTDASLACGGEPAGAATLPETALADGSTPTFSMPSNNIGCSENAYNNTAMICQINNHSWAMPADLHTQCRSSSPDGTGCDNADVGMTNGAPTQVYHTDVAPWASLRNAGQTIPVLQYGQITTFGSTACQSSAAGLLCWDDVTHHGFQMSVQALVYW
jgi:cytoskeletal protein RodZ